MINSIKAYAKINLHLEVLNKRPDGYHNICSIMTKINLYDLLQLNKCVPSDSGIVDISLNCIGGHNQALFSTIPLNQNLIVKAAKAYCAAAHIGAQLNISIIEEIPAGAGLAGGSTDAAATLLLLNRRLQLLQTNELLSIAKQLGADVPFCLLSNIALCEGIGEIVTPLTTLPLPQWVVLVYDDIHVNTKEAYITLHRTQDTVLSHKDEILQYWHNRDTKGLIALFKNDFQPTILEKNPKVEYIYSTLKHYNPEFVQMTGSGSAIFALFYEFDIAQKVYSTIINTFSQVFLTSLLL